MVERNSEAVEYALREARENDVKFIRLWFTDILGNIKGFAITVEELENALTRGMGFDGSSIEGYARTDERDLYALPDPTTFNILPWRPKTNAVARMFCDILTPDEKPFEGDPRNVLRRNLKRASDKGYTYYVAPEIEYFYFKDEKNTDFLRDNFELEVFEITEDQTDPHTGAVITQEIPLEFHTVGELGKQHVEYWFNIEVDEDVVPAYFCASKIVADRKKNKLSDAIMAYPEDCPDFIAPKNLYKEQVLKQEEPC